MSDAVDRYQVDTGLAAEVSTQIMRGRADVDGLSEAERDALREFVRRTEWLAATDEHDVTTPYIEAIADMYRCARAKYEYGEVGSRSFGLLRLLVDLGVSVAERNQLEHRARAHFRSQIMTALVLHGDDGDLGTCVALYVKYLIKAGLLQAVVNVQEALKAEHEKAIEQAREAKNINDWLRGLAVVSPLTDAQLLLCKCLLMLVQRRHISADEMSAAVFADEELRAEVKRLDELGAYTYSHGVGHFKMAENGCAVYIAEIRQLAAAEGPGVARRQTRYDVARLMIPRFLMNAACAELGGAGTTD